MDTPNLVFGMILLVIGMAVLNRLWGSDFKKLVGFLATIGLAVGFGLLIGTWLSGLIVIFSICRSLDMNLFGADATPHGKEIPRSFLRFMLYPLLVGLVAFVAHQATDWPVSAIGWARPYDLLLIVCLVGYAVASTGLQVWYAGQDDRIKARQSNGTITQEEATRQINRANEVVEFGQGAAAGLAIMAWCLFPKIAT